MKRGLKLQSGRALGADRNPQSDKIVRDDTEQFQAYKRQPMPTAYAVLDEQGRVLWTGASSHAAWHYLCAIETARYKVDAADHARVFASRGKKKTDAEVHTIARRIVGGGG